jgi:hypothetical protein
MVHTLGRHSRLVGAFRSLSTGMAAVWQQSRPHGAVPDRPFFRCNGYPGQTGDVREYVAAYGCPRTLTTGVVAVTVAVRDSGRPSASEAASRARLSPSSSSERVVWRAGVVCAPRAASTRDLPPMSSVGWRQPVHPRVVSTGGVWPLGRRSRRWVPLRGLPSPLVFPGAS